jgi:hypothetical protein
MHCTFVSFFPHQLATHQNRILPSTLRLQDSPLIPIAPTNILFHQDRSFISSSFRLAITHKQKCRLTSTAAAAATAHTAPSTTPRVPTAATPSATTARKTHAITPLHTDTHTRTHTRLAKTSTAPVPIVPRNTQRRSLSPPILVRLTTNARSARQSGAGNAVLVVGLTASRRTKDARIAVITGGLAAARCMMGMLVDRGCTIEAEVVVSYPCPFSHV